MGYTPQAGKESDTTEQLTHAHTTESRAVEPLLHNFNVICGFSTAWREDVPNSHIVQGPTVIV